VRETCLVSFIARLIPGDSSLLELPRSRTASRSTPGLAQVAATIPARAFPNTAACSAVAKAACNALSAWTIAEMRPLPLSISTATASASSRALRETPSGEKPSRYAEGEASEGGPCWVGFGVEYIRRSGSLAKASLISRS